MLDDPAKLLGCAGEEAWYVSKGDYGDLEGVAEANESSSFDRSVDVEAAGENLRLVCDDANRASLNLGESCDHVLGVAWHNLVEVVAIADTFDHSKHVVRLIRVVWNDIVK